MNKHKKSHSKRHSKRHNKSHKHKKTNKRHSRKHREIVVVPGSKSVPIFSPPEKKENIKINVNDNISKKQDNGIPGLRTYLNKMV